MTHSGRSCEVGSEVLQYVAVAPQVFCCLDYDGTLAPLAPTSDRAVPLRGTSGLLERLATAPGMHVAVVTGRTIADVRRFLDVPGIYYIGVHGSEVRLLSGAMVIAPGVGPVRAILAEIRQQLHDALAGRPGLQLEDKGAALAIHYRLAPPADAAAACALIARLVRECHLRGAPIMLAYGHEVAEIRHASITKGTTVCALLAAQQPAALPVYIGDDRTDEDAFVLLPPPAVTIRVGAADAATAARYRVAGPQAVHGFLRAVLSSRLRLHAPACGSQHGRSPD
jgi:trehalose-phosphatase